MTKKIKLETVIPNETLEKDIKRNFPDNYIRTSLFNRIILDDGLECRTAICVVGQTVKIRSYQPLWNLIILPSLGLLPNAAADAGRFSKMLKYRDETEEKYTNWIKNQYKKS